MSVYVVLKRRREEGIALPNFESFTELPEVDPAHKLLTLEPGDCVDVAKFFISKDLSYIGVTQYRVSNLDGYLKEEVTESYSLPRHGK